MENINNTLFDNIIHEKMYKNLIDIFDEVKQKNKTEQYLLNYCKEHLNTNLKKNKLYTFILVKYDYEYEKMFLQLMDLLPTTFIINFKRKDKNLLLSYFIYKQDYENFNLILSENCDNCKNCIGYCFFNELLFFKVIKTKHNDFIKRMFEILFLFLDENLIDKEDYDLMKNNIIILKNYYIYSLLHEKVNTLTLKLKNSYINYLKNEVYNESFSDSDNDIYSDSDDE